MKKKQLFIFPHAGGSDISYSSMERSLSHCFDTFTLCYPGRGRRHVKKFAENIDELVDDCLDQLESKLNEPVFFFMGHSFGALVAFECARLLRHKKMTEPALLFLSGRGSPAVAVTSSVVPRHSLSDALLTDYLKSIGGLPDELLADSSFLSFYLPVIRNDLTLNENYSYKRTTPVNAGFVIINGAADPVVKPEALTAWQQETTAECMFETLEGGHFFHLENPSFTSILRSYSEQYMERQLNCSDYSNLLYTQDNPHSGILL